MDWYVLHAWFERHYGILTTRRLRRPRLATTASLELLEEASEQGRIADADYFDLYSLDLIIAGRPRGRTDDQEAVIAVQIAVDVEEADVKLARDRARVLRSVGYETFPTVAGDGISESARSLAEREGVDVYLGRPRYWARPDQPSAGSSSPPP